MVEALAWVAELGVALDHLFELDGEVFPYIELLLEHVLVDLAVLVNKFLLEQEVALLF